MAALGELLGVASNNIGGFGGTVSAGLPQPGPSLGGREEEAVVLMVLREPQLLQLPLHTIAERIMDIRVRGGRGGAGHSSR